VADRHYLLTHGQVVYEGTNAEFLGDAEVKRVHLGI
jgi:ABC-type lipopolysaccharide export system ATPase subunit